MLIPILDKEESVFRNEKIFAADFKTITLDNVLVNLFMLMRNNGKRIAISFQKIAAHTGDYYNEEADKLAKAALTEANGIPEVNYRGK